MSELISEATSTKLFDAAQAFHDELPLIKTVAEALDPAMIPVFESIGFALSNILSAIVKMREAHTAEDAKPALWEATQAAIEAQLNAK